MKKNDINIIVDQNTSDTTKEKRDVGYLFSLMMKQREAEQDDAYLASLSKKKLLSVEEASDDNCPFVLWIGGHRKIKREEFEAYIKEQFSI